MVSPVSVQHMLPSAERNWGRCMRIELVGSHEDGVPVSRLLYPSSAEGLSGQGTCCSSQLSTALLGSSNMFTAAVTRGVFSTALSG